MKRIVIILAFTIAIAIFVSGCSPQDDSATVQKLDNKVVGTTSSKKVSFPTPISKIYTEITH